MKTELLSFSSSAILREEVKYVHTDTDLLAMEKAARGKKDIVLGYVRSLGTQGTEKKEKMDICRQQMLMKSGCMWVTFSKS